MCTLCDPFYPTAVPCPHDLALVEALKTAESPPMTVDGLLAKLDAEYERIAGELPAIFERYGRTKYSYPDDRSFPIWEIRDRRNRQDSIQEFVARIKQEVGKVTE